MPRIIVEGMDGSGKTTLINYLLDQVGDMKLVVNELGPRQNFNTWWLEQLVDPQLNSIHDRFFYSELVYGPILRGHVTADPKLINYILWYLRQTALLIYARPSVDVLLSGIKTNEQMEGVHAHFEQLLTGYDQLMMEEIQWYKNRFTTYAWNQPNEIQRVERLVRRYLGGTPT